jgi:hypothetical protein
MPQDRFKGDRFLAHTLSTMLKNPSSPLVRQLADHSDERVSRRVLSGAKEKSRCSADLRFPGPSVG